MTHIFPPPPRFVGFAVSTSRILLLAMVTAFPAYVSCAEDQTQEIVDRAAEQAAEQVAEKIIEEAAEHAADEVVEKVAERALEKAEEEAAEKAELTAERPDVGWTPTQVHFLVFVVDIDSIDDANQNFEANVYVGLRWKDRRLATQGETIRQIPLNEVWNPRVLLANRQGLVSKSLPEVVQVEPDGTVTYHQRYTGKLSQPLRLTDFPMDRHTFNVQFAAAGYTDDDLEFMPFAHESGLDGGGIADQLSLPDWKILDYEALALAHSPAKLIRTAGFAFRFEAERYVAYYLWQVVLPLSVVVIMSWAGFWIGREQVGVRIGVATSSILTLIAHRFVLASLLPRLPYMTRMDYFTVGSTLLVFLALVAVVITAFLPTKNREVAARRIDYTARLILPAMFLGLLAWFFIGVNR